MALLKQCFLFYFVAGFCAYKAASWHFLIHNIAAPVALHLLDFPGEVKSSERAGQAMLANLALLAKQASLRKPLLRGIEMCDFGD